MWDVGDDDDALRVDAAPAFGAPLRVGATRGQLRALVARLRAAPRADAEAQANRAFHAAHGALARPAGEASWEALCADVLAYHCARHVLDGAAVPLA